MKTTFKIASNLFSSFLERHPDSLKYVKAEITAKRQEGLTDPQITVPALRSYFVNSTVQRYLVPVILDKITDENYSVCTEKEQAEIRKHLKELALIEFEKWVAEPIEPNAEQIEAAATILRLAGYLVLDRKESDYDFRQFYENGEVWEARDSEAVESTYVLVGHHSWDLDTFSIRVTEDQIGRYALFLKYSPYFKTL